VEVAVDCVEVLVGEPEAGAVDEVEEVECGIEELRGEVGDAHAHDQVGTARGFACLS
jgi:hypothetical protein